MRIIFFAGKGGVGKTSVAAATGIRSAEMGNKTVVMSLDIAHSLSDAFDLDRELIDRNKGRLHKVGDNLWIQELDILEEIEKNWQEIHQYLALLLNTTGLDEILAEELAILPGMEEVSLLLYINRYVKEKKFDCIILDCAPTGESLRFISIPTALEWYINKVFKMERTVAKYVRPLAKVVTDVPIPEDGYFDAIASLFERLQGVDRILADPQVTTVRLITNPEKIVLKETQRAFMYFCLYQLSIDGIIMNRLLPKTVKDTYFSHWQDSQKQYSKLAEEYFNPIPIFPVTLLKDEVLGYDRLKSLGDKIYGNRNPLDRFFREKPYNLVKENSGYKLLVNLPFAHKGTVDLHKISDELILRVGAYKRHILLPKHVAAAPTVKAKLEGQHLSIAFEGVEHGKEKRKG
jgi:arsenite-transporting ATPase